MIFKSRRSHPVTPLLTLILLICIGCKSTPDTPSQTDPVKGGRTVVADDAQALHTQTTGNKASRLLLDLPEDSAAALKLARSGLAAGQFYQAIQIVDAVLSRQDSSRPDALALKIEILLGENDLKAAEEAEDRLVILYPDHPAAKKGARLVYQYYLKQMGKSSSAEKINSLESYLKRHPGGMLHREAAERIEKIRAETRSRYQKRFDENLAMAQGFIRQGRFENARKELDAAEAVSGEAFALYKVSLDTDRIVDLRDVAEKKQDRIETAQVNGVSFRMIRIPAGEFLMGSPSDEKGRDADEGPQHKVRLTAFWMAESEVTQRLWHAVMGNNPSSFKGCDDCPVETVSWDDVQEFIGELNRLKETDKYRLPTEAEWEYAARSGSTTRYYCGNDARRLGDFAWYSKNSKGRAHPVMQKNPNGWGLYDMDGNIYEWCEDVYSSKAYQRHQKKDPLYLGGGSLRVVRGGSWNLRSRCIRSADRGKDTPFRRYDRIGFRLVRAK